MLTLIIESNEFQTVNEILSALKDKRNSLRIQGVHIHDPKVVAKAVKTKSRKLFLQICSWDGSLYTHANILDGTGKVQMGVILQELHVEEEHPLHKANITEVSDVKERECRKFTLQCSKEFARFITIYVD